MNSKNLFRSSLITFSLFVIFSFLLIPKTASADNGFFSFLNSFFPQSSQSQTPSLSSEDLAKLIQPSIVRIVRETKGNVVLHSDFALDYLNLKVLTVPLSKPINIPVDDIVTGTGFMITPEGHIMSNSHVVSSQESVNNVVAQLILYLIKKDGSKLTVDEQNTIINNASSTEGLKAYEKLGTDLTDSMLKDVTLEATTTITVLNPKSTADNLADFIKDGFPATVVSVNDNFSKDQRDVAIIKINKDNLPAIPVSSDVSTSSLVTGQKIFAFGFPSTADLNKKLGHDIVVPTYTSGTISALKSSDAGDFQIIETDTKISSGSSGSPAFDENGNVIGIMTYATSNSDSNGDTFAFALPIGVIKPIVDSANVISGPGALYEHFTKGLNLLSKKHCALAITEFESAKNTNGEFPVNTSFIDSYMNQCKTMQANGLALDTEQQQFLQNIKPYQLWVPVLLVIFIFVICLIFVIVFFSKKMKKEEEEIYALRARGQMSSVSVPPTITPVLIPKVEVKVEKKPEEVSVEKNTPPAVKGRVEMIVDYINKSKTENKELGLTVIDLRSQGYSDDEIQQGFNLVNKVDL